jgi:hypothetical protein
VDSVLYELSAEHFEDIKANDHELRSAQFHSVKLAPGAAARFGVALDNVRAAA